MEQESTLGSHVFEHWLWDCGDYNAVWIMECSHETELHIGRDLGHIKPVKSTNSKIDSKDTHSHDNHCLSSVPLVDWICKNSEKNSSQSLTYQVQHSPFKLKHNDWSTNPTYKGAYANYLSSNVSSDLLLPWNRLVHNSDHPVRENVENINSCVLTKSWYCACNYCTPSMFRSTDTIAIGALSFLLHFHLFFQRI